jgi:hypothetical protein
MTNDQAKAKRVLQIKLKAASPDASSIAISMLKNTIPFFNTFGEANVRLLRNVDDPAQFLQLIEYRADASFELNRHKLASDPMFQAWRSLFAGVIEVEVYEEVIANG